MDSDIFISKAKLDFKPNILHLLKTSYPSLSGYTVRSHFILTNQKSFANPYAVVDPYFIRKEKPDIIENNIYYRYPPNLKLRLFNNYNFSQLSILASLSKKIYISLLKTPLPFVRTIVKKKKIDLIHGHTYATFSSFGERIAREEKIPFIYEVRGFWEDSRVAVGRLKEFGYQYMKIRKIETKLMKKADFLITLGKMMKKEISSRGIEEEKIFIVPNGVDIEQFQPEASNANLKHILKIEEKKIIAYIGSIQEIEGIETLIKALKIVKKEIKNTVLLLIGSCYKPYKLKLKKLIKKLGINNSVRFIGQIEQRKIKNYYSIIDIIIIPRIDARVCRLVTPLKQLEAMAMKKIVITSDLPALCETVKPRVSGDIFKTGNSEDLADKIIYYLNNQEISNRLREKAREYVQNNHNWKKIAKKYKILYEKLLE